MTTTFPTTTAARHLLALDWGTSSLRARLMLADGTVLREASSADGILSVPAQGFETVFEQRFGDWLREFPDTVVLAAGMVGSRQGWVEAPYLACPAGFGEMAAGLVWPMPDRRLAFVPGLSTTHDDGAPDVMRGEEVQIFGALDALGADEGVFVLPGTHSKWAHVAQHQVRRFHTFMTGELYALLRRQSILARAMPADDTAPAVAWPAQREAFLAGVQAARDGVLLHKLFSVRARGLFGQLSADAQPDYLSGMLVGEEILEALSLLGTRDPGPIHLVCNADLCDRYRGALAVFGLQGVPAVDHASFRGLLAIAHARALLA
ncbi:2-dehydro-3-deoxygalactonokinase [Pigmentiphaga aceris]|uniref:2-dehydro-3-deoxygalactonokinase n=1 Tax=Pigmentiphaga aceris TaxID=1940612 RepID=A0A5C0AV65_9BURK|nr:2-dehydro-3-deoxygalactonokinase [Pigmentiphaga aceris]QEI05596.1 2-dehydro-3-deoxygalactonokinase [Pigmentiphaga aceris]